jgi:hypothetical protein
MTGETEEERRKSMAWKFTAIQRSGMKTFQKTRITLEVL